MSNEAYSNGLKGEKSAYLKQHQDNPVQWLPYGEEALQKAKDENKPIFLSIGYSSCHWCHVMAGESFEDQKVAELLNKDFINIKVDREEFPDLDNYYQLACQVMNGKGGWPLNAFLTPDMKPYFVGTYFPKTAVEGIPSFTDLVTNLAKAYTDDFQTISDNSTQVLAAIKQPPHAEEKVKFEGHYPQADSILNALKNYQDNDFGGYGVEPKFPMYSFLEWAIEHMLEGMVSEEFGNHIITSIEKMLMGGLYDHVRGGVHRYSVDKEWKIPHFEKMLYDQAGFIRLLAKTSLIYPSPLVFDALIQTIDYLQNEMLSENGYFFSSQDGDSEGVEGLYFGYTKDEFLDALMEHDQELIDNNEKYLKWFGITEKGNFDHNLNIISFNLQHKEEFYGPDGWNEVRKVKEALLETRKMRIPPTTDNKGVASWNFQTCTALLDVVQYCKIDVIAHAALELLSKCNQGIHQTFIKPASDGKNKILSATTKDREIPLFEDYVFYSDYCFRNYELSGMPNYLENAYKTLEFIFSDFYKEGVFYTRSLSYNDAERFENIHTPIFDQSYRSPLSCLIQNLRKWSIHNPELKTLLEKTTQSIETLTHLSLQNPLGFGETLRSLVYPNEAYRKIEVPHSWLKESKFQGFFANFSIRFALTYHMREDQKWQICTSTECEVEGDGVEEFARIFSKPEAQQ